MADKEQLTRPLAESNQRTTCLSDVQFRSVIRDVMTADLNYAAGIAEMTLEKIGEAADLIGGKSPPKRDKSKASRRIPRAGTMSLATFRWWLEHFDWNDPKAIQQLVAIDATAAAAARK